jgi:hypothetical protein
VVLLRRARQDRVREPAREPLWVVHRRGRLSGDCPAWSQYVRLIAVGSWSCFGADAGWLRFDRVRIPFPYWALVPLEDWEPYVNATQLGMSAVSVRLALLADDDPDRQHHLSIITDHLQQGLLWAKTYDLDVIGASSFPIAGFILRILCSLC